MEPKADFLFEASWEVCNKVGGIYTVVRSKITPTKDYYGENYFLVGPYIPENAHGEFEQKVPPDYLEGPFSNLKRMGIICHYGLWLVPGTPHTILIDFHSFFSSKNDIKKELWEGFGVDSLGTDFNDFDIPIIWSYAVGLMLKEIKEVMPEKKIVAQFHEWLAGAGLLHLKKNNIKIGTVFTTHATMLGRTLASQDVNIYSLLDQLKPEEEARKNGIISKFHMERECAKATDVFTTVSEITALEAEKLLGRKPDVVLANGLDMDKFATFDELMIKHRFFKNKIKEFLSYYFFPYYKFDMAETQLFFTCARYEFHTKGLDILIKALAVLNRQLKEEKSNKTIVTFFWIPGNIRGIKPEIIKDKTQYFDLKESIEENLSDIRERILNLIVTDKKITEETLFDEDVNLIINKKLKTLKKEGTPPLCTHNLFNEDQDAILNGFRQAGLLNKEEDRVKVIFYPIYLTGADSLLDTAYYESMLGSNLGIFPSYYEPWGYTPFEAAALACPSITTDLAGFGRFIEPKVDPKSPGIIVINRLNKDEDDIVKELGDKMKWFVDIPRAERVQNRISAKALAGLADWRILIGNYITAHNMAMDNVLKK